MSTLSSYSACRYYKGGTLQSTSSPGYYGWDGTSGNWVMVLEFTRSDRQTMTNVAIQNMYRSFYDGSNHPNINFKFCQDYSGYINAGASVDGDGILVPYWDGTYYTASASCSVILPSGTNYLVFWPDSTTYCVYGYTGSNGTSPVITYEAAPALLAVNARVKIGGAYKTVTKVQVKVGGVWKNVTKLQVKVGGAWKTSS